MSRFRRAVASAAALWAVSAAGAGPALAAGNSDCSAHVRYVQDVCDRQLRGEYTRNHDACRSDDPRKPSSR